ncbi:hypothetical protein B9T26_04840 [Acinetobacter sp. ANC 4169]|uniref:hypothetical protein n=1 Tax=Acinetobacter sp. ANC 4169 TaxID=1977879 RepID=UPI000A33CEBB|nr:hypothetical protein [Acinetobacter sp. ANC 4169]OTG75825.1 hypothetical protein B9T26_04840 [Acinetobacter sp. ANC 4169]
MRYTAIIQALSLSLSLGFMAQLGHAAAIKATEAKLTLSPEKSSLIEKALQQQKHGANTLRADNDLKILTEIKVAPTQSFFAAQNQKFSRFVQALFPQNNS